MVKNISSTLNAKKRLELERIHGINGRSSRECMPTTMPFLSNGSWSSARLQDVQCTKKTSTRGGGGGGLATAFELAAFRLSMIALVKKSVNHSRTVANMPRTGWEQQQQEVRVRSDSVKWIRFCSRWSLLSLLQPIFVLGNVELTFSFLLVLRLSLHAVYYAKNETSERSLYMFLDARPFGSLQAFKLHVFLFRRPTRLEQGANPPMRM